MAKKLKQDYVEEAIELGAVQWEDEDVVDAKYTRDELREMIQFEKKVQGFYWDADEIAMELMEYVRDTDVPILAKFCGEREIPKSTLNDLKEKSRKLAFAIKILHEVKEGALEDEGLNGDLQPSMAIFSLKQLGWTDERKVEHETGETFADFLTQTFGEGDQESS